MIQNNAEINTYQLDGKRTYEIKKQEKFCIISYY